MAPLARLELSPWPTVVIEWGCYSFAAIFVALRIYQRHAFPRFRPISKLPHMHKPFGRHLHKPSLLSSSDIMVIFTLLCFLASVSLDTTIVALGFNDPTLDLDPHGGPKSIFTHLSENKMRSLLQILWISAVPYYFCLWGIKISLLMFYYTLFPLTMPKLRVALNFTTVIVLCSLCVVQLINLFWCWPAPRNWSWKERPDEMCLAYYQFTPYAVTVGLHIGSELLVFSLPFPLLSSLHLSPRRKRTLIAVFVTGFAGVCVSIGRVICVTTEPAKRPSHAPPAVIGICQAWAALEMAVGIIVVCVPSFKTLCARLINGPEHHERKNTGEEGVFGCMGMAGSKHAHDQAHILEWNPGYNYAPSEKGRELPPIEFHPSNLMPTFKGKDDDAISECTTIVGSHGGRPGTRDGPDDHDGYYSRREDSLDYGNIQRGLSPVPPRGMSPVPTMYRVTIEREKGFGSYAEYR